MTDTLHIQIDHAEGSLQRLIGLIERGLAGRVEARRRHRCCERSESENHIPHVTSPWLCGLHQQCTCLARSRWNANPRR